MPGGIRSVVGERECRRTMTPTVTIIIPTYNEAAAVPAACLGVVGALCGRRLPRHAHAVPHRVPVGRPSGLDACANAAHTPGAR